LILRALSISDFGVFRLFFLKSIKKHDNISSVKAAEYSINVTFKFDSYFIQSISPDNMLKKLTRYARRYRNGEQYNINLLLNFFGQRVYKIPEISPEEY